MGLCLGKSKSSGKADKSTVKSMNNKVLLEKLIASSNGNYNPIRDFSFQELTTATNNYDRERIIIQESGYILYKGVLNARAVSILKFGENYNSDNQYKFCFNNIVFGSQMSHKNILKLIGCCLETQIPILVFESIELGTLADRIYRRRRHNFEPLPFRNRLKVAMELANAVAYLHAGFARPIIFMSATPWRIFFDEQNVAKLSDFSLSVSIPEGETHVDVQIAGTRGYIAPEVLLEAKCNEKYDVHSFGIKSFSVFLSSILIDHPQTLEKLISSFNGKRKPILSFSAEELKIATNNYDLQRVKTQGFVYQLYTAFLHGRPVSVMKFQNNDKYDAYEWCLKNIVFASQMSHSNILMLIGCCLETQIPVLVFESVSSGILANYIHGPRPSHFEPYLLTHRLKIAMEIANALAYPHVGFPRPTVFKNIKLSSILFDEDHVAKLFDFSLAESIPDGETHIKDAIPIGIMGFVATKYGHVWD
ncbi:protein kinase domain-containing protein [Citrus sinensis]|uniref:Protein kinase domain-containing protein n=1 Tax=Citrus sinensis TaxID=2711 RepID=A0ACB8KLF7_CITSI|nr:protein kinase domain-containing protein [Citrus sinensis]